MEVQPILGPPTTPPGSPVRDSKPAVGFASILASVTGRDRAEPDSITAPSDTEDTDEASDSEASPDATGVASAACLATAVPEMAAASQSDGNKGTEAAADSARAGPVAMDGSPTTVEGPFEQPTGSAIDAAAAIRPEVLDASPATPLSAGSPSDAEWSPDAGWPSDTNSWQAAWQPGTAIGRETGETEETGATAITVAATATMTAGPEDDNRATAVAAFSAAEANSQAAIEPAVTGAETGLPPPENGLPPPENGLRQEATDASPQVLLPAGEENALPIAGRGNAGQSVSTRDEQLASRGETAAKPLTALPADPVTDTTARSAKPGKTEADGTAAVASVRKWQSSREDNAGSGETQTANVAGKESGPPASQPVTLTAPTYPAAAAAGSEPTPAVDSIKPDTLPQAVDIFRQVAEKIRFVVGKNGSEVNVQLKPDSLGRMNLRLELIDGALTAKFYVESSTVREVLEARLPELRASLQAQGIECENAFVYLRQDNASSGSQQQSRNNPYRRQPSYFSANGSPNQTSVTAVDDVRLSATGVTLNCFA